MGAILAGRCETPPESNRGLPHAKLKNIGASDSDSLDPSQACPDRLTLAFEGGELL
jgi:hypothetical protein